MALESFITAALQICCVMHVFSWLRHKNTNNVFRLVLPVYDIDTYVFNFNLVTKQARVNPSVPQPRSGCSLVAVSLSVTTNSNIYIYIYTYIYIHISGYTMQE